MARLSRELREALSDYFAKYRIPLKLVLQTDVTVALIRIGTPAARLAAEEILGKKITVTVGQVVLKEKKVEDRAPKVTAIRPRSYDRPGGWTMPARTEARFQKIRVGMTRSQIASKGVPQRDISRWTKSGNIVWSTP